jgi:hypothetical protein
VQAISRIRGWPCALASSTLSLLTRLAAIAALYDFGCCRNRYPNCPVPNAFLGPELCRFADFEIRDRLPNSGLEIDFRLPAEKLSRPGNIGPANLRIIFRQRLLDYFRLRSGNFQYLIRKFENGHFARITDVYRLMLFAHSEPENAVDQI